MSRVLLQPASGTAPRTNFEKTIRRPVSIQSIARFLNSEQIADLEAYYPNGSAPVWGLTPNRGLAIHAALRQGDPALFYGNSRFYACAFITTKVHNPSLADHLWGEAEAGDHFEYVYFLSDLQACDIPLSTISAILERSPNWVVMGAELLSEEISERIADSLGLYSELVSAKPNEADYRNAISAPREGEPLDRDVVRKQRVEQAYLRGSLFGKRARANCALCNREFSVRHLVAAHIKKRSTCAPEEKLDVENIVLPMCKFGCDALFESRAVSAVDGIVCPGTFIDLTERESEMVTGLGGRTVTGYRPTMEKYFRAHIEGA